MNESLFMMGVMSLMCGVFVLCVLVAVFLGVIIVRIGSEDKDEVLPPKSEVADLSRAEKAIFKQWDNLLGYNGAEGENFDE